MLPTTASKGRGAARSAPPLFGPYLRRIVKVRKPFPPLRFPQNPSPFRLHSARAPLADLASRPHGDVDLNAVS
nr:unnamed protein product [Digitaria exilis]